MTIKADELTEMKTIQPPKPSRAALECWFEVIKDLFRNDPNLQQIVIPARVYESTDSYEKGRQFFIEPKVLYRNSDVEDLYNYINDQLVKWARLDYNFDIALSTNVMLIMFGHPPECIQLDIIDVAPDAKLEDVEDMATYYNVLKTQNSFHLYAKFDVEYLGEGETIIDEKWNMRYIRVTESDAKGPIEKYIFPPKPA